MDGGGVMLAVRLIISEQSGVRLAGDGFGDSRFAGAILKCS